LGEWQLQASQSKQKVSETPSHLIPGPGGVLLPSEVMQEAEIGRITVPDQPGGKKSLGDPILLEKSWM
jgi:hypothetical protein